MSLWPKLRKRSRGRKKGLGKVNPYSSCGLEKFERLHAELEAERLSFSEEKGIPVSVIRFVSHSQRLTPIPLIPSLVDSARALHARSGGLGEVVVAARGSNLREVNPSRGEGEGSVVVGVVSSDGVDRCSVRSFRRSTLSIKEREWIRVGKASGGYLWSVGMLSVGRVTAAGARTVFALTVGIAVDSWMRTKLTGQRVVSLLAAHMLTVLQPYSSLGDRTSLLLHAKAARVAGDKSGSELTSFCTDMKDPSEEVVSVPSLSLSLPDDGSESPLSSPVFAIGSPSPHYEDLPILWNFDSPRLSYDSTDSPRLSVSMVAAPAPALPEKNHKPSCRLRSKLFKPSPARKVAPAFGDLSPATGSEDDCGSVGSVNAKVTSVSVQKANFEDVPGSPAHEKDSSTKKGTKQHFLIFRKKSAEETSLESLGSSLDSVVSVKSTCVKKDKVWSGSHELFACSPRREKSQNSGSVTSGKNESWSQEVTSALKGKRIKGNREYRSQEYPCAALPKMHLPDSTITSDCTTDGLRALAFPAFLERSSETRSLSPLSKNRGLTEPPAQGKKQHSKEKKTCTRTKVLEKQKDKKPVVSNAKSGEAYLGKLSRQTRGQPVSTMNAGNLKSDPSRSELRPWLREVKTGVRTYEERARVSASTSIDSSIYLYLVLFVILGFLLLGKIPAIVGTSCVCLAISRSQRFFSKKVSQVNDEKRNQSSGARLGNQSPRSLGSPINGKADYFTSDFRKKVLIDGLLERGTRSSGFS